VESLESAWIDWLRNDRPAVAVADHEMLADALARQGSGQNLAAVGMDSTDVPQVEGSTASGSGRLNRFGNP
jgi:hypothetical protein